MTSDSFPPPEAHERSLFLTSRGKANGVGGDGRLQWQSSTTTATDSYRYDPVSPVRSDLGVKSTDLPIDINYLLDRDDVLVYTTEPLDKSLTVIGDVVFELIVSSTAPDTDFVIEFMDVLPDGRSIKLGSKAAAQLRARYRNGLDREMLMSPDLTYVVSIDMHAIGHTFLPGNRIRLAVTSSFFPWISANPNTGGPIATDTQPPIVANQTIYHAHNQPSRIRMMVIDNPVFDSSLGTSLIITNVSIKSLIFPMLLAKTLLFTIFVEN
ncbi:unnamed protein product [Didymodactylos carnosus]|nr:unnamed protein product [Didymodactylos carnosus]CAF3528918.1 unnamed protein product [Didymodactylos carnosus]